MAIASMTGFARGGGSDGIYLWTWEAKSVNGRGLDVRCRMPPGLDQLDGLARAAASRRFARGTLTLSLTMAERIAARRLQVNREALAQVLALVDELGAKTNLAPPRLDGLLAVKGVVELGEQPAASEETVAARERAIVSTLEETLVTLAGSRAAEGAALAVTVLRLIDEIDALVAAAAAAAGAQPEAIRARLHGRISELLGDANPLPGERLAQEVALMVARADVREELDRLRAHAAQARSLLAEGGAIGRRLDFLAQEFNREANTLCSKSTDIELTRTGLALKAAVDQLREQAANIE